jgi:hypothetical protein
MERLIEQCQQAIEKKQAEKYKADKGDVSIFHTDLIVFI